MFFFEISLVIIFKIKIHIPLESAIPFLGLDILAYVYKDLGTIIFIAILFVITD